MKKLIKTIQGQDCEIYVISHHNRFLAGKATPCVEVYEHSREVPTIGTTSIRYKRTCFSVVICPDPEMDATLTEDIWHGMTSFDLTMMLPRGKDGVLVPFVLCDMFAAELSPEEWVFEVTDPETVRRILTL